jgi:dihydrodipicolinate synthase/N-acetylneuraminate lyase
MAGTDAPLDRIANLRSRLRSGLVIPAHPLALTAARQLDERRQVALTRYYCDAGAGGIAVGVHTTQFAIRTRGLLAPVLTLAAAASREREIAANRQMVRVAGICGPTGQALEEAELAARLDYDAGLLSLAALSDASNITLIEHCRTIASIIPVFGFYLQPSVGGRVLDYAFWRAFLEIDTVVAIKVAPFNRYQTLDVTRALSESGRRDEVALYTGNDDAIVMDLVTPFPSASSGAPVRFVGGLLGQWAVWTNRAVELLAKIHAQTHVATVAAQAPTGIHELIALGAQLTDANAALFDAPNGFAGCIAGIHEVLRRQGLLAGRWCLDPQEDLSPGQMEEIDRVYVAYPHLVDDSFVSENLHRWLG